MPLSPHATHDLDATGVSWKANQPLAKLVWWRVGGPADAFVTVKDVAELAAVVRVARTHDLPIVALGNGSNTLVSDDGVDGIVLRMAGEFSTSVRTDDILDVGAGLKLTVLLNRAEKQGWAGLDALAGIPGTVGGAVRMNAGTSLGEIGDTLVDIDVVRPDGTLATLSRDELAPTYRHTELPDGTIITRARIRISDDDGSSAQRLRAFLDRRKATQPLDMPSCGSTFTNPPGDHAGRLIDAAGLKGFAIGGAQVSPKHANFIVNTGDATAVNIRDLIEHVLSTVEAEFSVRMRPEVVMLGRW